MANTVTLGGNPVSTAAGLAVLDYIEKHDLCKNAEERGEQLRAGLRDDADWLGALPRASVALFCWGVLPGPLRHRSSRARSRTRPSGSGSRLQVDWLSGRVPQEALLP